MNSAAEEPEAPATQSAAEFPDDPVRRLEMAAAAFRRAEYALLVPLLEPICEEPSPLAMLEDRVRARELLVVGYFFVAQQVTSAADRDTMLNHARDAALQLLREQPDHALDALVFPVSIVDLFEDVRQANATELDALLATRQGDGPNGEAQTVYLERGVVRHLGWVNFLPFAAGQFQNGHLVKGTIFAVMQGAGLVLNATSYFMILRLQNPETGRFSSEDGLNSDLARAKRWRQALYGGLIGFASVWVLSIVDGWLNYETETVRIRTLDAPPPELGGSGDAGASLGVELGLTLEFRW